MDSKYKGQEIEKLLDKVANSSDGDQSESATLISVGENNPTLSPNTLNVLNDIGIHAVYSFLFADIPSAIDLYNATLTREWKLLINATSYAYVSYSFPDNVVWANYNPPTFETGMVYELSFRAVSREDASVWLLGVWSKCDV